MLSAASVFPNAALHPVGRERIKLAPHAMDRRTPQRSGANPQADRASVSESPREAASSRQMREDVRLSLFSSFMML